MALYHLIVVVHLCVQDASLEGTLRTSQRGGQWSDGNDPMANQQDPTALKVNFSCPLPLSKSLLFEGACGRTGDLPGLDLNEHVLQIRLLIRTGTGLSCNKGIAAILDSGLSPSGTIPSNPFRTPNHCLSQPHHSRWALAASIVSSRTPLL